MSLSELLERYSPQLIEGFTSNLLMTLLAALIPLLLGVGMVIVNRFVKGKGFLHAMRYVSLTTEILTPVALIVCLYFHQTNSDALPICILGLSLSHLFYIPARMEKEASIAKNLLEHGLGLLASLFKWSFVARFVGQMDLLRAADIIYSRTYEPSILILPVVASALVLLVLLLGKTLVKNLMK